MKLLLPIFENHTLRAVAIANDETQEVTAMASLDEQLLLKNVITTTPRCHMVDDSEKLMLRLAKYQLLNNNNFDIFDLIAPVRLAKLSSTQIIAFLIDEWCHDIISGLQMLKEQDDHEPLCLAAAQGCAALDNAIRTFRAFQTVNYTTIIHTL